MFRLRLSRVTTLRSCLLVVLWWTTTTAVADGFAAAATTRTSSTCRRRSSSPTSLRGGAALSALPPLVRSGLRSAGVMTVADVATQVVVEGRADTERYDLARTLRWSTVGLCLHGPYFRWAFGAIDRLFVDGAAATTTTTIATVLRKTLVAQTLAFPPYLVLLFLALGVMEGSGDVVGGAIDRVPRAFRDGCVFWPLANLVNFRFVPSNGRVAYVAIVGALWNGWLSHTNHRRRTTTTTTTRTRESADERTTET